MPEARSPFRNQERKAGGSLVGWEMELSVCHVPHPRSPRTQTIKPNPTLFSHESILDVHPTSTCKPHSPPFSPRRSKPLWSSDSRPSLSNPEEN